ncbi:hypothetical protein B0H34DRAFT_146939 [Crassisporium funariophilum]|nr:hypothetical protein B0H34DRAFT_146939 [Crassisporium funariophilum]
MAAMEKREHDEEVSDPRLPSDLVLADLNAEVNLEIALREQLVETVESRIAWACILQKTLQKMNGNVSQDTFRNVALDALGAVESSSGSILSEDPPAPASLHANRAARPPPRKTLLPYSKSKPSFLYIRSATLGEQGREGYLYLLKCPQCSRTAFTSLQGLFNHARLTHKLEWGTHDECIRACAVLDNDLDLEAGVEVGLGPTGVLPGLRSIFQIAVGAPQSLEAEVESNSSDKALMEEQTATSANYLTQTLGLHEDTPALAQYLGKQAIRREIKVWEEDSEIDVTTLDRTTARDKRQSRKRLWKMPFAPRNVAGQSNAPSTLKEIPEASVRTVHESYDSNRFDVVAPSSTDHRNTLSNQSRFHFVARIVIADRSLSISPEQRLEQFRNHSHKWMISVDSPSYAHHITTILTSLSVTSSDASVSVLASPMASKPPFVVVGTSDRPFLARVELAFTGVSSHHNQSNDNASECQRRIFEHWVELDPLQSQTIVLGEEQVLDVELDRNTILNPVQSGYTPIVSKSLWDRMSVSGSHHETPYKAENSIVEQSSTSESFEAVLDDIVKRFPMTQNDIKGRRLSPLPYKLVASPAAFKALIIGRRKAIEWGRARAIQDAYRRTRKQELPSGSGVSLTVGDVYAWLVRKGHFPVTSEQNKVRSNTQEYPRVKKEEGIDTLSGNKLVNRWCHICGLEAKTHPSTDFFKKEQHIKAGDQTESVMRQPQTISFPAPVTLGRCQILPTEFQIPTLPVINILGLTHDRAAPSTVSKEDSAKFNSDHLVAVADPHLTLAIRKLVGALGLSLFSHHTVVVDIEPQVPLYPLDEEGQHKDNIIQMLGPCALLALLTKSFIRKLVEGGLEVVDRNKIIAMGLAASEPQTSSRRTRGDTMMTSILSPTHILSGVLSRKRLESQDSTDAAILSTLSKLGVAVDGFESLDPSCQGEFGIRVKVEG